MIDEKQLAELVTMFKSEARDHLATINRNLLSVERGNTEGNLQACLEDIFRSAHSLKGAARSVGFGQIEAIAHHLESVFSAARRGQLELAPAVCDVLYRGLDTIEAILANINGIEEAQIDVAALLDQLEMVRQGKAPLQADSAAPQTPVPPPEAAPQEPAGEEVLAEEPRGPESQRAASSTPGNGGDETIRVGLTKIEELMAQADELLVSKISSEQRLADLRRIRLDLDHWQRDKRKRNGSRTRRPSSNGHGVDQDAVLATLGAYQQLVNELAARLTEFEKNLTGDALRLGLVTANVQDGIRRARMLPFHTILGGFRRMVRDLSRELGKDIAFEEIGTEVELDKKVLEEIRDPLMHLLRNAIAHGIETSEERETLQKPRQGTVTLQVVHQGSLVDITVSDDGRGLDLEAIRKAALKARVMDRAELEALPKEEVSRLVLLPGVTTSRMVTGLSGRGVGLDVVRQKINDLHGDIEITSQPGEVTSFHLTVPVSLATTHGLLIRIQDETYAIPLTSVEKIVSIAIDHVRTVEGREMIAFNGEPIALVRLDEVLERPQPTIDMSETMAAIVLKSGNLHVAFVTDELIGEQEMVVKRLGKQLEHVRNVAGATLLGTGQVVIILNPQELIRSVQKTGAQGGRIFVVPQAEAGPVPTILVVDDSITTRTLEKNILEAAGYEVVTAIDGIEAMDYLRSNGCDLVVSDIQMPRMNGFELTKTIKESDDFGHLPLLLVTSLESQDDRKRGLNAGADAYIVKNAFDQDDLLATIRQLL